MKNRMKNTVIALDTDEFSYKVRHIMYTAVDTGLHSEIVLIRHKSKLKFRNSFMI
jgi:hypothetical protein